LRAIAIVIAHGVKELISVSGKESLLGRQSTVGIGRRRQRNRRQRRAATKVGQSAMLKKYTTADIYFFYFSLTFVASLPTQNLMQIYPKIGNAAVYR
jgi:hypothetical protein